jgi:hypothetical protein
LLPYLYIVLFFVWVFIVAYFMDGIGMTWTSWMLLVCYFVAKNWKIYSLLCWLAIWKCKISNYDDYNFPPPLLEGRVNEYKVYTYTLKYKSSLLRFLCWVAVINSSVQFNKKYGLVKEYSGTSLVILYTMHLFLCSHMMTRILHCSAIGWTWYIHLALQS